MDNNIMPRPDTAPTPGIGSGLWYGALRPATRPAPRAASNAMIAPVFGAAAAAEQTGLAVPEFLEAYNELYGSVALYRETFDNIKPMLARYKTWLADVKTLPDDIATKQDRESAARAAKAAELIATSITERLDDVMAGFRTFRSRMSGKAFARLRRQVEDADAATAAIVFGFAAKLRAWSADFPYRGARSGLERVTYLRGMLPGLERLRDSESEARLLAANF